MTTLNKDSNQRLKPERKSVMRKAVTTSAILAAASLYGITSDSMTAAAQRVTPQEGMVYSTHSPAKGDCPELFWHVTVGPKMTLLGMVGHGGMQDIWRLSGTYTPEHTLHLDGQELGGAQRTGSVDGEVRADGSLIMTIGNFSGPSPCANKTIYLPWFRDGNDFESNPGAAGGSG
jgi:hypothetical protein